MAIDRPLEKIISLLGHDGSEIVFPQYKVDPLRRRAFHITEINFVAWNLGWSLVEFATVYFEPLGRETGGRVYSNTPYIEPLLKVYNAVLIGEISGSSHAVAWNCGRQLIYDPSGSRYERHLFNIHSVHVAIPIGVKIRTEVCKTQQQRP